MEVCIIGSLNEEIILGPISKWPEWGRQVFVDFIQRRKAGSAVSVALPLARLGVKTGVVGVVGDDENSVLIKERLSKVGVDTRGVIQIRGKETGLCVSFFRPDAERAYISALSALTELKLKHLKEKESYISKAKIILLTGCFVTPGLSFKDMHWFFRRCRKRGQLVCLDTGWDPQGWQEHALTEIRRVLYEVDVFLPNEDEARIISGKRNLEDAIKQLWVFGPNRVYIKRGVQGCIGGQKKGEIISQKGFPVKTKDVTAAGEAFNAGIIYGFLQGMQDREMMRWANAMASLFLASGGKRYPSKARLLRLIKGQSHSTPLSVFDRRQGGK